MDNLTVRGLNKTDYDNILLGWWSDWGWTAPPKDFLPNDGTGGIMVLDGDEPICAGFVYLTNSKVAWVDWIISNREYTEKQKRKDALDLLIASLTKLSRETGNKFAYALIKNQSLINRYERFGYIKGDSYTGEMIKLL